MANETNIRKWTAALRSGEYEQTKSALRRDLGGGRVGYCCLGVACDVYRQEHPEAEWSDSNSNVFNSTYKILDSDAVLPQEVMEWLGLEDYNPEVTYKNDSGWPLAVVNDTMGANFKRIAAAIEETFL